MSPDEGFEELRAEFGSTDDWPQIETVLRVLREDYGWGNVDLGHATRLLLCCYAGLSDDFNNARDHSLLILYLKGLPAAHLPWLDELASAINWARIQESEQNYLQGALFMARQLIQYADDQYYGPGYRYKGVPIAKPKPPAKEDAAAPAKLDSDATRNVGKFARRALESEEEGSVSFEDLYSAYQDWCAQEEFAELPRPDFDMTFIALCKQVGFR